MKEYIVIKWQHKSGRTLEWKLCIKKWRIAKRSSEYERKFVPTWKWYYPEYRYWWWPFYTGVDVGWACNLRFSSEEDAKKWIEKSIELGHYTTEGVYGQLD